MAIDQSVADHLQKLKAAADGAVWASRSADPLSDSTLLTCLIVGFIALGFALRELFRMFRELRKPHDARQDSTVQYATSFFGLLLIGMTLLGFAATDYRKIMDYKKQAQATDFSKNLKNACTDFLPDEPKLVNEDLPDEQVALIQRHCDPFFRFGTANQAKPGEIPMKPGQIP